LLHREQGRRQCLPFTTHPEHGLDIAGGSFARNGIGFFLPGSSFRTMPTSRHPLHVVAQQFSGQCHHQIPDGYHAFDMAIRIQQQLQMLTQ
jgi:hypothetical protein